MSVVAKVQEPLDEQARLERERAQAYVRFAEAVEQARGTLCEEVLRVDELLAEVHRQESDLDVLVRRSQGVALTRYHSATHPCRRVTGRGRDRANFEEVPESQAQRSALTRCTACRWSEAERAR